MDESKSISQENKSLNIVDTVPVPYLRLGSNNREIIVKGESGNLIELNLTSNNDPNNTMIINIVADSDYQTCVLSPIETSSFGQDEVTISARQIDSYGNTSYSNSLDPFVIDDISS